MVSGSHSMASKFQSSLGDDTANRRNKAVAIEFSVADSGCPTYVVCNAKEARKATVESVQHFLVDRPRLATIQQHRFNCFSEESQAVFERGVTSDERVRSFGMIQIRINDPRSFGSWYIKGTEESLARVDSSVPLIHHDLL